MVAVDLVKIIIDEKAQEQAVVLREQGGVRQVPIVIGFPEVTSIQMKVAGIEPPRPLTHDLLVHVLQALDARGVKLVVDDVREGTFFAKLHLLTKDGQNVVIDCRPSDGIALAVRLKIPLFVVEGVFNSTLPPEE